MNFLTGTRPPPGPDKMPDVVCYPCTRGTGEGEGGGEEGGGGDY